MSRELCSYCQNRLEIIFEIFRPLCHQTDGKLELYSAQTKLFCYFVNINAESINLIEKLIILYNLAHDYMDRYDQVKLSKSINELRQMLDDCIGAGVRNECIRHLQALENAVTSKDFASASNQAFLFILTIKRNMGAELSLMKAFQLVDVMIMDIQRIIADPSEIFPEALSFTCAFFGRSSGTMLNFAKLPYRPLPDGVEQAGKTARDIIVNCRLPSKLENQLLVSLDVIVETAILYKNGKATETDTTRFLDAARTLYSDLIVIQGTYLPQTTVNRLMGVVLLGWPAWLCYSPVAIIVQIAAILILLAIGEVNRGISAARVKTFLEEFGYWFAKGEDLSYEGILAKLRELLRNRDFTDDEKKELRDGLERLKEKEPIKNHEDAKRAIDDFVKGLPK